MTSITGSSGDSGGVHTIFVLTETWLSRSRAGFVDKFGPRIVVFIGGILCAAAWAMNSVASSLALLYVSAAIAASAPARVRHLRGAALKWFPDRRGLAAGLTPPRASVPLGHHHRPDRGHDPQCGL